MIRDSFVTDQSVTRSVQTAGFKHTKIRIRSVDFAKPMRGSAGKHRLVKLKKGLKVGVPEPGVSLIEPLGNSNTSLEVTHVKVINSEIEVATNVSTSTFTNPAMDESQSSDTIAMALRIEIDTKDV